MSNDIRRGSSRFVIAENGKRVSRSSFKLRTSISLASTSITGYCADGISLLDTKGRIGPWSYLSGKRKRIILPRMGIVVYCILHRRIVWIVSQRWRKRYGL